MKYTQFLIFEICRECNLGKVHDKCPNLHPARCEHCDKSTPLTDEKIIDASVEAYEKHGFSGAVGFHYYNEPLIAIDRIERIIFAIRQRTDKAKFVLWTNGHFINDGNVDRLKMFDIAWLTRYDNNDYSLIKQAIPKTNFVKWQLDKRLKNFDGNKNYAPCGRIFSELIFDYYGNVHICCIDWRGEVRIGNLNTCSFADLLHKFIDVRDKIAFEKMLDGSPDTCLHCSGKHGNIAPLVPDVAKAAIRLRAERKNGEVEPEAEEPCTIPAVVFVAYKIPHDRVRSHFDWNKDNYKHIRAFVVVDEIIDGLPDYVEQLVFTDEMPIFNLSKTKNFGIRAAIESGCNPVISTDADMVFSRDCWNACAQVSDDGCIIPVYHMASSYANRSTDFVLAPAATGTISARSHMWRKAHYHEESKGYGSDDAIVMKAMKNAGAKIDRFPEYPIYHIAHIEGTPQKEFCKENPRIDHWNRGNGFNPENFKDNHKLLSRPTYSNNLWGLSDNMHDCTIVLTHYNMPEKRLAEFFEWNDSVFRWGLVRVIVVSDKLRYSITVPQYARVARFPRILERFSLAQTSNYGIRLARQGVIVKTDPDCLITGNLLEAFIGLQSDSGLCPIYHMAMTASASDLADSVPWDASKGTLALHWDTWDMICGYDERLTGYGLEDGDAFCRSRVAVRGDLPIYHIAHDKSIEQDQHKRRDIWNGEKFNRRNHRQNQSIRRTQWENKNWGLGIDFQK